MTTDGGRTSLFDHAPGQGSYSRYSHGCRCSECREAHARYSREWVHRNPEKRYAARYTACPRCGGQMTKGNGKGRDPEACATCMAPINAEKARHLKLGNGPVCQAVIALVSERPRRYAEIRDALGITSSHASNVLCRLTRSGLIDRPVRGLYQKVAA